MAMHCMYGAMTAVVQRRIALPPPLPPPPPLAGGGTASGYARVIVCSILLPSASVAVTRKEAKPFVASSAGWR